MPTNIYNNILYSTVYDFCTVEFTVYVKGSKIEFLNNEMEVNLVIYCISI